MRHTGGSALGLTSTKSFSASRASRKASWTEMTPMFSLFGPITRTSRTRISSLMRYSDVMVVIVTPLYSNLAAPTRERLPCDGGQYTIRGRSRQTNVAFAQLGLTSFCEAETQTFEQGQDVLVSSLP